MDYQIEARLFLKSRASISDLFLSQLPDQQIRDYSRVGHFGIGQTGVASVKGSGQASMIQAQRREQSGMQVLHVDDIFNRRISEWISGTIDATLFESSSGDPE